MGTVTYSTGCSQDVQLKTKERRKWWPNFSAQVKAQSRNRPAAVGDQDELVCTEWCLSQVQADFHSLHTLVMESVLFLHDGGTGKFTDLPELQQLINEEHLLSK